MQWLVPNSLLLWDMLNCAAADYSRPSLGGGEKKRLRCLRLWIFLWRPGLGKQYQADQPLADGWNRANSGRVRKDKSTNSSYVFGLRDD